MEKQKIVIPINEKKAVTFEADMTEKTDIEFAKQLQEAGKGASSLQELIMNVVHIQKRDHERKKGMKM